MSCARSIMSSACGISWRKITLLKIDPSIFCRIAALPMLPSVLPPPLAPPNRTSRAGHLIKAACGPRWGLHRVLFSILSFPFFVGHRLVGYREVHVLGHR